MRYETAPPYRLRCMTLFQVSRFNSCRENLTNTSDSGGFEPPISHQRRRAGFRAVAGLAGWPTIHPKRNTGRLNASGIPAMAERPDNAPALSCTEILRQRGIKPDL